MSRRLAVLHVSALLFQPLLSAQQQTGAPAGIPVPIAPVNPSLPATTDLTGQPLHYRVRVVDGRNGSVVPNAHVKLWYDEAAGLGYEFATDARGVGLMPAPVTEPVRVLVSVLDYTDCRRPMRGDPPTGYNFQAISRAGVAAQNGCGTLLVHATPGELILFVRHSRWYEGINKDSAN